MAIEVLVSDNTTTLIPGNPKIIALANNTQVNHGWIQEPGLHPSTLAGVVWLADLFWGAEVYLYMHHGGSAFADAGNPSLMSKYINDSTSHSGANTCQSYLDPQPDVMQSLNLLMFTMGGFFAQERDSQYFQEHLDPGLSTHTNVTGYLQGVHNVFHTAYGWFIAAALVELTCILLVLPTYWGWWKIGRSVSLSPLEIAKVVYPEKSTIVDVIEIILTTSRHLKRLSWPTTTRTLGLQPWRKMEAMCMLNTG